MTVSRVSENSDSRGHASPTDRAPAGRYSSAIRRPIPDFAMINFKSIDDLARRLSDLVPPGARAAGDELQANFRAALQSGLAHLDLVPREEFDVQRAVLLRTREKLDQLERTVEALEARLEQLEPRQTN